MKEVARHLQSARNLARRGRFADAEAQASAADRIHPKYGFAAKKAEEYRAKIAPYRKLVEALHRAVSSESWSETVSLADQILELAPECPVARDVRRRAWAKVGAAVADSQASASERQEAMAGGGGAGTNWEEGGIAVVQQAVAPRFLLWIDGVGGFLTCLNNEVVIGQATPHNPIAIPIQADLSRHHARIVRRGDGYVIEPLQTTWVNGQLIRGKTLLSDGDEIEMTGAVRLRFRQPHALSASARLDFLSHHRTFPKADGILLMAESCVLGPKSQNHVLCRDWQGDVVLYRRDGELYCRAMDSIEIDGHLCDGHGQLGPNSHVSGSDFSLSLEELS
jgi:hypothetical protein